MKAQVFDTKSFCHMENSALNILYVQYRVVSLFDAVARLLLFKTVDFIGHLAVTNNYTRILANDCSIKTKIFTVEIFS